MAVFDFKKQSKDLYQPTTAPTIVDVPAMLFLMTDGVGDPNTSPAFSAALEALYSASYAIRMNKAEPGYFAYVVPPVEGFWDFIDPSSIPQKDEMLDKQQLRWTLALRQPDFVTPDVFTRACEKVAKKKPQLNLAAIRLERFTEGLCVQALHLGSYDDEPATIRTMEKYQQQRGFRLEYGANRRHHEIYLSNPKKTEPDRMKTILRQPVKRR